jgi:uncharacterized OB-fold protein
MPMTTTPSAVEIQKEHFAFSGFGEVFSFTTVQDAPEAFKEQSPYMLALIKLDEGAMVTAQLTDLDSNDSIHIGDRVEMVTRKLMTEGKRGVIVYGYKFRKVLKDS